MQLEKEVKGQSTEARIPIPLKHDVVLQFQKDRQIDRQRQTEIQNMEDPYVKFIGYSHLFQSIHVKSKISGAVTNATDGETTHSVPAR